MDYVATARRTISQIKRNGMVFPLIRGGGVTIEDGIETEMPEEKFSVTGIVVEYSPREIDGKLILAGDTRLAATNEQEIRILTSITHQRTGEYHSVLAAGDNADVFSVNGLTKVNFYSLRGALDVMNGKEKRIAGIKSCL